MDQHQRAFGDTFHSIGHNVHNTVHETGSESAENQEGAEKEWGLNRIKIFEIHKNSINVLKAHGIWRESGGE